MFYGPAWGASPPLFVNEEGTWLAVQVTNPGLLYALPTAAGLYSDAGRKAMAMLLARRPEWAARFAQQLQQRGMPLAASVGAQQELSQ